MPNAKGLEPNYPGAAEFALNMASGRSVHLVAIGEERGIIAKSFDAGERLKIAEWIERENQSRRNIYFTVNPLKDGVWDRKAKQSDVQAASFLHIDVDRLGEDVLTTISKFVSESSCEHMCRLQYFSFLNSARHGCSPL